MDRLYAYIHYPVDIEISANVAYYSTQQFVLRRQMRQQINSRKFINVEDV